MPFGRGWYRAGGMGMGRGLGRGMGRGMGLGYGMGMGRGNPYPFCRFNPSLPRRWWAYGPGYNAVPRYSGPYPGYADPAYYPR